MVGSKPIGGHIHFGLPEDERERITQDTNRANEVITTLDTYLAHTLALIEKPEKAQARKRSYGHLHDYRNQPHGLEYRPPSSWLVSPEISAGVLSLSFAVINGALRGELHNGHAVNSVKFYQHDYDYLRDIHEEAKREVVKLPEYRAFQPYIDYIYSLIRRRQSWNDEQDIRQTWGFVTKVEGLKQYPIEEPERVFELRKIPLTPEAYAQLSLNIRFNYKDLFLPHIAHKLETLIEVRDDGLRLDNIPQPDHEDDPNWIAPRRREDHPVPPLYLYGLRDEGNRPQIRINRAIPRAQRLASFLRQRGYEVELCGKWEHKGIGLRTDLRRNIKESAKVVFFCILSASGITRLGRRERVIEYNLRD